MIATSLTIWYSFRNFNKNSLAYSYAVSHPGHLAILDWLYPISNEKYLPSPELEGSEDGMILSSLTTDADEGSKLIATEEQEESEKRN